MRIPTGNFGQVVPEVRPGSAAFDNTQVSHAADRLARTVQGAALTVMDQQNQEDKALARVRASNQILDREAQLKTITADLGEKARTGQLTHDQLGDAYEKAVSGLDPVMPKGLDQAEMEGFNLSLKRLQTNGSLGIQQLASTTRIAEARSDLASRMDMLGKDAGMPGSDPDALVRRMDAGDIDTAGRMAYGQDWDRQKQNFKDNVYATNASQRINAARDSMGELSKLEHELTAEDGYYSSKLDANKRTSALNSIMGFKTRLENRAMAQEAKREASAQRTMFQAQQQIASGIPAPAGYWDKVGQAVSGTTFEGDYKDIVKSEGEIQNVLRLPVTQQMDYVQKKQASLMESGGTVKDGATLARLSTAVNNNIKQLQDQPLLYAQARTGVEVQPLDVTQLVTGADPSKLGMQLADRASTITGLQNMFGSGVKMRPFLPQEATALAGALQQATPRQQGQLFGILKDAFQDDKTFQGAMQQIAPDAPVKALAGMIYSKQKDITLQHNWVRDDVKASSGDVAETMLTGENILNKTKGDKATDGKAVSFPLPKESDFRTEFASLAGNVFAGRPEAFNVAMQAVRSYYTGKSAQDGDVSGEINPQRMKQAVSSVIGTPTKVNGGPAVLTPWGMDEDSFYDQAKTSFQSEMTKHGMPEALTNNFGIFGLENASGDTYRVVQGGDYLRDKKGQPIIIKVGGGN